jgi:hypothetical protein
VIQAYGADYLYRIIVNSDELSQIFTAIQESVTYTNYKGILQATPGQEKLCSVAHAIWSLVAEKFGGAYQQRGCNRQRSLLDSERDERTLGDSPARRTIHATDSHGTLDDAEPPPLREHKFADDQGVRREGEVAHATGEMLGERAEARSRGAAEVGRRVNNLKRWNEWNDAGRPGTYSEWKNGAAKEVPRR